jgi:hypothetical protein
LDESLTARSGHLQLTALIHGWWFSFDRRRGSRLPSHDQSRKPTNPRLRPCFSTSPFAFHLDSWSPILSPPSPYPPSHWKCCLPRWEELSAPAAQHVLLSAQQLAARPPSVLPPQRKPLPSAPCIRDGLRPQNLLLPRTAAQALLPRRLRTLPPSPLLRRSPTALLRSASNLFRR